MPTTLTITIDGSKKMAASNGTLVIAGATGKVYSIDCYVPEL
jgi:hypothetical protein